MRTFAAALLLLLPLSARAATTAAEFLNFGVGGRATGMGGAYSAVADDATALYWNPAALTRIERRSAVVMHAAYLGSSYFDYAAYGQNLGKWGAVGAGFQYYSAGSITQTDATGADSGSFSPYDLAATLGYAYRLPDFEFASDFSGLTLGVGVKYVQSRIIATARTEALDVGALLPAYFDGRLRTSVTATNLSGRLTYAQTPEILPQTFRFGSSFRVTPRWIVSADAVAPVKENFYGAAGTEYWLPTTGPWKFACRAGFNSQTFGSIDGFTGAALGFGLGFAGTTFDYAFVPYGGLGQAHRVSLTYAF